MKFRSLGAGALITALAIVSMGGVASAQAPDLSSLHDALHLTAAQEDGWRMYRMAIQPDPSAESRHRAAARLIPTLATPRRVDLMNAEMSSDMAYAHRQGEAVKAFYASLDPDQQRAFDRQTAQGGRSGGQPPRSNGPSSMGGSGQPPMPQPPTSTLPRPQN